MRGILIKWPSTVFQFPWWRLDGKDMGLLDYRHHYSDSGRSRGHFIYVGPLVIIFVVSL